MSKALREAEVGLANMVSYQSTSNSPTISEYGQARRALDAVRAALANQEAGSIAAEPVAYRAMTRNWGTAQDEEWVYGPWLPGLGSHFEPLYAGTPPTKGPEDVGSSGLGLTTKEEK